MNQLRLYKPLVSFLLRKNPLIEKRRNDFHRFIPQGANGVIVFSADFELSWAWRLAKKFNSEKQYVELADQERKNIPDILDLCDRYNIPITWGTVGHLFLENCDRLAGVPHGNIKRLPYFENEWWQYPKGDWFDCDPCTSWDQAKQWYCPDLVEKIRNTRVHHEFACHTFSHIDCSKEICSEDVLTSELEACRKASLQHGIELKTFIFPGHTMGNYDTLVREGFIAARTNFRNMLGYPVKDNSGLWLLPATLEIQFNPNWSWNQNQYRYLTLLDLTVKRRQYCHFWFHPSCTAETIQLLEKIFSYIEKMTKKPEVITMLSYTQFLKRNN